MIYQQAFEKCAPGRTVRAGVIGTGQYATAIVTQSRAIERLDLAAVADLNISAARRAFLLAGWAEDDIVVAESHKAAIAAMEMGKRVVVPDAEILVGLPLQVVVESTGVAEAGARHAMLAIERGKHVAMVTKETDAVVGPMLKRLADRSDLVYTAVDGDQHGLLISLVNWARTLGLEVVCGGKARDTEFVYDPDLHTVSDGRTVVSLAPEQWTALNTISPGMAASTVAARRDALAALARVGGFDLTELAIAANATALLPDVANTHCPALRTAEIPEVFCPTEDGGILDSRGAIDCLTSLHKRDEAGLGGGVWIVVACRNDYSRMILTTKGLLPNAANSVALIYRPYHLCGVETPLSILSAGLLGLPTGASDYVPRVDLVARAREPLRAGDVLSGDHDGRLEYLLTQAKSVTNGSPLPLHMGTGKRLIEDVAAGTLIRTDMVERPQASALWRLREAQDREFGLCG